jgi:hypothetical protein
LYAADELTGALVLQVRTQHKVSRAKFSVLAGLVGKSTAHLYNIETKDSWKPGDRDRVARALNDIVVNGPVVTTTQTKMILPKSTPPPAGPIMLSSLDLPDDTEDTLAQVLPAETDAQLYHYALPSVDPYPAPTEGVYRISNSELQTFKRCKRKWWLGWYRELTLKTESYTGVRSTGTRIHRALAAWYVPEGEQRVDPRDALERVIVEDWTSIQRLAIERNAPDERVTELATEFSASCNLERAMVEGYVQWLEETGADSDLRIIASETPLVVDIVVPMREHHEMRDVQLIGLLDTRAYRVTDGIRVFIDHKTVGSLTAPVLTLPQNEQMLHYHILEMLSSVEGEERCDGALYNMLRRVKRSAKAKPPFYDRIEVRHNPYELESYRRRLLATTREVLETIDALDRGQHHLDIVYPTPNGDCSWSCDFSAICNMFDDGSSGTNDMLDALYKKNDPRDRYDKKGRDTQ